MNPDEPSAFAEILRSFRVAAGLSQEQLAERARLSARGISDLERGARRTPRLQTVRMLADALCLGQEHRIVLFETARPSRTAPRDPSQLNAPSPPRLPLAPTPLVGREHEIASIVDLLCSGGSRLVTLTGPGGVGKTRLALEAIPRVASTFPDGAHLVELAPVREPSLVRATLARSLGIPVASSPHLQVALERFLSDKRLVIVLDNVEHVVSGTRFVADLLAACPGITVLTTSRVPLRLRGERQFLVRPLQIPDAESGTPLTDLANVESVQLFVERARDTGPDFALSDVNADAIATVCRRLDGLPLALELAAARITILPPTTLVSKLGRSLPLLSGDKQDVPERHRTLRSTIAWSFDLLPTRDQMLLRRMAVFAGGWTMQAAVRVTSCDNQSDLDVMESVESLVRASLVQATVGRNGAPRFTMLGTVREFAQEQLETSGEAREIGRRHADYVFSLAQAGAANLADDATEDRLACLEAEQANIRAALGWFQDNELPHDGLRLATALGAYWRLRSAHAEGRSWLERFLKMAAAGDTLTTERVEALRWAGELACLQGDSASAERHIAESLALARLIDDRHGISAALGAMASALVHRGDVAESVTLFAEGVTVARELGDRRQTAFLMAYLAFVTGHQGNLRRGEAQAAESAALVRSLGDTRSFEAAFVVLVQGWLALMESSNDLAAVRLKSAISLSRTLGAKSILSAALAGLGEVALRGGRTGEATASYREGLVLGWEGGYPPGAAMNLQGLVRVAVHQGELARAARLAGAVERFGGALRMLPGVVLDEYEYATALLRSSLQEVAFETEQLLGRALGSEDLVAQELAMAKDRPPTLDYCGGILAR